DETTLLIQDSSSEAGVYEIGMGEHHYYRKGVGSIRVNVKDINENESLTLSIRKAFTNDKLSVWSEKRDVVIYAKKLDVSNVPSYPISVEEKEGKVQYCSVDTCWDSLESIDIMGMLKLDTDYEKILIRDIHNSLIYVDSNEGIPTKTLIVDGKEYHFDLSKITVTTVQKDD
ncbi:MAG: hypothetical protein HUJ56_01265, partial [Erysipelotrichaceae bacterium]|nr:hypothetical protein [Erysipelotrichaceae bacterium]